MLDNLTQRHSHQIILPGVLVLVVRFAEREPPILIVGTSDHHAKRIVLGAVAMVDAKSAQRVQVLAQLFGHTRTLVRNDGRIVKDV